MLVMFQFLPELVPKNAVGGIIRELIEGKDKEIEFANDRAKLATEAYISALSQYEPPFPNRPQPPRD